MLQISVIVSRLRRCYDSFSTRFDNLFASFQCPSSCCCCCPCANKEIHSLITPFPHSTSLCPIRLLFIELKKRRNDGWSESDSELVVTKIMNDQSHGTLLYARKAIFDMRLILLRAGSVIVFLQRCALRSQDFAIFHREYVGFENPYQIRMLPIRILHPHWYGLNSYPKVGQESDCHKFKTSEQK